MPHLSTDKLHKKFQTELYERLCDSVELSKSVGTKKCLSELLTDTERIMLAKRLTAVLMFESGFSSYRVWNTLHLSPSTANEIRKAHEIGEFRHLTKAITKNKKHVESYLKLINQLVRSSLPPMGKKRFDAELRAMTK